MGQGLKKPLLCPFMLNNMKTHTKVNIILVVVLALSGVIWWNLPDARSTRQAWKSNTVGLHRTIVWTGVEPRTWSEELHNLLDDYE